MIFLRFVYSPRRSSAHRAAGQKDTAPIYRVLVRPKRESYSRPANTEADELTTGPAGSPTKREVADNTIGDCSLVTKIR